MGAKILLVDDDPATMSGLVALLQNAGYDVIAVSTMQDARRALVRLAPDLLITDVRLGAHNGLNLLVVRPQPIPAIVITGFDDPVLEADARRMGAEFLVKPIAPARLVRLIERMLSREDDKPVRNRQALAAQAPDEGSPRPGGSDGRPRRRRELRRVQAIGRPCARGRTRAVIPGDVPDRCAVGQRTCRLGGIPRSGLGLRRGRHRRLRIHVAPVRGHGLLTGGSDPALGLGLQDATEAGLRAPDRHSRLLTRRRPRHFRQPSFAAHTFVHDVR